jgi:hypothetical protein
MPTIHPKAKSVTIDGKDFLIAPLSMLAIEVQVEGDHSKEDWWDTRIRLWKQIEASMKRADPENAPNIDVVREELDLEGFAKLLAEVRSISNLSVKTSAL